MLGELTNNLSKLTTIDENIATEERKLNNLVPDDVENKRNIEDRIKTLRDERVIRLQVASINDKSLQSQLNRLKETFQRIRSGDTTLAEKIKTLFREQGITIVSILTALDAVIAAIVESIIGTGGRGSGGSPTPEPPPDKGSLKE